MQSWKQAPEQITPDPGVIDIWRISLALPEPELASFSDLLTSDETARAQRFQGRHKYREYIICRGLLRKVLGLALNCDPRDVEIRYTDQDKPYLAAPADHGNLQFNVSHSHEQALIALTKDQPIGIDIEHLRTNLEFNKMASRFFSSKEADDLNTYTDVGIPHAFFACWTRKEAFVKALGEGIAFGLSEFSVSVDPYQHEVDLQTHWDETYAKNWSIRNIESGPGYVAALAVAGKIKRLRYWYY